MSQDPFEDKYGSGTDMAALRSEAGKAPIMAWMRAERISTTWY